MLKKLSLLVCGLVFSGTALAQNYGVVAGVHQTSADISFSTTSGLTGSVDGKMGFKLGAAVSFELMEAQMFRTGLLYVTRNVDVTVTNVTGTFSGKLSYLDIPALYQYNINEMVGFFGGLIIAINTSDTVESPAGFAWSAGIEAPEGETLSPLLNFGVNLTFDDQIGADFYYERGMGKIISNAAFKVEDFSTFGANFLYWF